MSDVFFFSWSYFSFRFFFWGGGGICYTPLLSRHCGVAIFRLDFGVGIHPGVTGIMSGGAMIVEVEKIFLGNWQWKGEKWWWWWWWWWWFKNIGITGIFWHILAYSTGIKKKINIFPNHWDMVVLPETRWFQCCFTIEVSQPQGSIDGFSSWWLAWIAHLLCLCSPNWIMKPQVFGGENASTKRSLRCWCCWRWSFIDTQQEWFLHSTVNFLWWVFPVSRNGIRHWDVFFGWTWHQKI